MKIKHLLFFLLFFSGFLSSGISQQVYTKAGGGMCFPYMKQPLGDFKNLSTVDQDQITETFSTYGFANGFSWSAALGMKAFDNFALEVGFYNIYGKPYKVIDSNNINTVNKVDIQTLSAKSFYTTIGFVLSSNHELVNPYMRFDYIHGKCDLTMNEEITHPSYFIKHTWKYDTKKQSGFKFSAGTTVKLSDRFVAFTEFNVQNITFSPDRAYLTKAIKNQEDVLSTYKTIDKEVEYVGVLTKNPNDPPKEDMPEQRLKQTYSLCSLGFQIGLRFNIFTAE